MSRSRDLFERARAVIPGGVHSPVRAFTSVGGDPRFIAAAAGATLTDVDGARYTDYCMAFGPLILGHADPVVRAAIDVALERGWSYGAAEQGSLELAELVCGEIPWVEQLRLVNSGTEAVMSALRLARAATGRSRILKFTGCYHGHADAMLIRAGSGLADAGRAESEGIPPGVLADTHVLPLDDEEALDEFFEAHGASLAAAIIEPLPANFGLLPQRDEFLSHLASCCRRHGALLIFDEVISGFRTGFSGYAGRCGVRPDLVTYGKIIGGGLPAGAYGGRRELMAHVAPAGGMYQAGTLSANPLSVAAGLATLARLRDGQVYAQLDALGARLERQVAQLPGLSLQRVDSLFWLTTGKPPLRSPAAIPEYWADDYRRLFRGLLERGIYLPPGGLETCFLSAAHGDGDIDRLAAALGEVMEDSP